MYGTAQVFVQPSYHEGMSNTVLEAMACGLPVVTTGRGGREELYRDNALCVPYRDVRELAGALVTLLSEEGTAIQMGKTSREIALRFSWQAAAQAYLDLYRRVGTDTSVQSN